MIALALDAVEDLSKQTRRTARTWNGTEVVQGYDLVFIDRGLAHPDQRRRAMGLPPFAENPGLMRESRSYLMSNGPPSQYERSA